MNYMNVLSDFEIRLNRYIPDSDEKNEISKLNSLIREKEQIIDQQLAEIEKLKKKSVRSKTGLRTTARKENKSETKILLKKNTAKKSEGKTKTRKKTTPENPFTTGKMGT